MFAYFLLKCFIDVRIYYSRIAARIHLHFKFVIVTGQGVKVIGQLLDVCSEFGLSLLKFY